MKNSVNLAMIILIAVVLGCTCSRSGEFVTTPAENKTNTNSKSVEKTEEKNDEDSDIFSENKKPGENEKTNDSKKSDEDSDLTGKSTDSGKKIPTLAQFNRIKPGMSYEEVVAIIGFEGDLIKESNNSKRYLWGDNNSFIMISFEGEKVSLATQNNLK